MTLISSILQWIKRVVKIPKGGPSSSSPKPFVDEIWHLQSKYHYNSSIYRSPFYVTWYTTHFFSYKQIVICLKLTFDWNLGKKSCNFYFWFVCSFYHWVIRSQTWMLLKWWLTWIYPQRIDGMRRLSWSFRLMDGMILLAKYFFFHFTNVFKPKTPLLVDWIFVWCCAPSGDHPSWIYLFWDSGRHGEVWGWN